MQGKTGVRADDPHVSEKNTQEKGNLILPKKGNLRLGEGKNKGRQLAFPRKRSRKKQEGPSRINRRWRGELFRALADRVGRREGDDF